MNTPSFAADADRLLSDYDRREPCALFAERDPERIDLGAAYALQHAVSARRISRGERPLGYKVGCIGAAIQRQFGLDEPVCARVWANERHASGASLALGAYDAPAVEAEIAVRMRTSFAPAASDEEIAAAVETWFPVIELHQYVFRGGRPTSAELIAGGALHAGIVTGRTEVGGRMVAQLAEVAFEMEIGGAVVERTRAADLPGGPLGSLRWLAKKLAEFGRGIAPGDVILTGSPGKLHRVSAPGRVVVRCSGEVVEAEFTG